MTEPDHTHPGPLKGEIAGLAAEVREMLALRAELARQELAADAANLRRLAVAAGVAAATVLAALPLPAVAAAWQLAGCWRLSFSGWLLVIGLVLLTSAGLLAWLAWRRFRRELVALAGTLEECREDLAWLQEWIDRWK